MPTASVGSKALETTINHGPDESSAEDSSCGFAKAAHALTKTTNSATFADKSTSILATMPILMDKSGFSVSNATNGCTVAARSKMVTKICYSCWLRMNLRVSNTTVQDVDARRAQA